MEYMLRVFHIIKYFRRFFLKIVLVSLLGILISILMLYQPKYVGEILSNYSNISKKTIIYFFLLTVFLFILSSLKYYVTKSIAEGVAFDLRKKVFTKLLYTSLEKISTKKSGDIISVLSNDINLFRDSIGSDFFDIFEALILLAGSTYFLIVLNFRLFIYTVILFLTIIIFNFISSIFLKNIVFKQQEKLSEFVDFTENFLKKIVIIKAFWLVDKSHSKFEILIDKIYFLGIKNAKVKSVVMTLNSLIFQLGIIIIVLLAGLDVSNKNMDLSQLAQFVLYSSFLVSPISIIANVIISTNMILALDERIANVYNNLDFSEKYLLENNFEKEDKKVLENSVEVKAINFSYEGKVIFENFSASFEKNKINLIIGESGSGKTTLIKLLTGLYKVDSGEILIEGKHIAEYSPCELRTKIISYVPQESLEWGETIYDSITLGEPYQKEEIISLLRKLNLYDCIFSLNKGLDTEIGTVLAKLSAGELQRIAILRGMLRKSEIFILDEPTANLDSENEIIVNKILTQLAKEKTIIIVSHKNSSEHIADHIIKIK